MSSNGNHNGHKDAPHAREMELWLEHLDTTIGEVFGQMLGVTCLPSSSVTAGEEQFKVVLHVTGEVHRTFCLYFDKAAARAAVHAFTQEETDDWEHQVEDAVGEIGNMVVGTLKRKLITSSIPSALSTPTVTRESRPLPSAVPPGASRRDYEFLDNTLEISLNFGPAATPIER